MPLKEEQEKLSLLESRLATWTARKQRYDADVVHAIQSNAPMPTKPDNAEYRATAQAIAEQQKRVEDARQEEQQEILRRLEAERKALLEEMKPHLEALVSLAEKEAALRSHCWRFIPACGPLRETCQRLLATRR